MCGGHFLISFLAPLLSPTVCNSSLGTPPSPRYRCGLVVPQNLSSPWAEVAGDSLRQTLTLAAKPGSLTPGSSAIPNPTRSPTSHLVPGPGREGLPAPQ